MWRAQTDLLRRTTQLVNVSLRKPPTPFFGRRCLSKVTDTDKEMEISLQETEIYSPFLCKEMSLKDAPTDVYLVCDTNLVINYTKGKIPGWREYADKVAEHGETYSDSILTNEVSSVFMSTPLYYLCLFHRWRTFVHAGDTTR